MRYRGILEGVKGDSYRLFKEKGELMKLIDIDAIKLPEGFFEKVDNVPKFYDWLNSLPTIEAIPISFIENRITELAKERNKYEIGTPQFRFIDVKIYYYEMLMEEWRERP